ncbi:VCBS domain-containing protein [Rhodoferax sp.]|uniref:VCBS domain-containing protein n=1 Tax=Rhodoferax sp. TaxID=50421 RepID=UPI00271C676C|nr:VCBS domain-containing protein [Rhodoferax sp.]MDO9143747.1 VCBS domain-containing protein [Rhodoferax sp.]MDP3865690.1 VCBS domain-containing protein [Rhodoferax sp.]
MSFSYDYTDYGNTVDQGTLASSYTNALTTYFQFDGGASIAAYLAHVNGLTVDEALVLQTAIEKGEFSLSGLFGAAQSKVGAVYGDDITNPVPTLTVGDTVINLSAMFNFDDLDTATWETITKKTGTIYHTREFYSDSTDPEGYTDDWAAPQNEKPTAEAITWDVNEYDDYAVSKGEDVGETSNTIDLLTAAKAADPEGLALSVSFTETLPSYITYADGKLTINTDSTDLDYLKLDEQLTKSFTYQISDGVNTIDNTVNLTITGTADQFTGSTYVSASVTSGFNTTTWDGSFNFTLTAPAGAFDFAGTALVTVTGDIDNDHADNVNDEYVNVTLEGGSAVKLETWAFDTTGPNQEGSTDYSTDTASANFASVDKTVSVSYDSNTAGGTNGVDGLSLVGVDVTADYTYWL